MKHGAKALIVLLLLLFALISTAQNTADSALKAFQRIQGESRNQRNFRYEDGAPKKGENGSYKSYTDVAGYLWVETQNPVSVHRFNGTSFQDMTRNFEISAGDSIQKVLQADDKTIYIVGKHHLFRWEGHKFTKFAFPKDDTIDRHAIIGNKVLCIGSKGYAVLEGKAWKFTRINMATAYQDYDTITITTTAGSLVTYTFTQIDYNLGKNNTLFRYVLEGLVNYDTDTNQSTIVPMLWNKDFNLECFTATGKYYIPLLSKEDLQVQFDKKTILIPQTFRTAAGNLYLYFYNKNLMFRIDEKTRKAIPAHFPEGTMLKEHLSAKLAGNDNNQDFISYYFDGNLCIKPFDSITSSESPIAKLPLANPELEDNVIFQLGQEVFKLSPMRLDDNWSVAKGYKVTPEIEKFIPFELPDLGPIADTRDPFFTKGKYLVYSTPDKALAQVHNVYVLDFDLVNPTRKYRVVDPAPYLDVLDYNEQSELIMLAGKEQITILSTRKPSQQIYSFEALESSDPALKPGNFIINSISTFHNVFYRQRNGKVEKLVDLGNSYGGVVDLKLGLLYYLVSDDWQTGFQTSLYSFNLATGKSLLLVPKRRIASADFIPGNANLVYDDFSWTQFQNNVQTTGNLTALKVKLDSLLSGTGVEASSVLNMYHSVLISEDELFFDYKTYTVEDQNGKKKLNQTVSYSAAGYTDPFPKAFALKKGEKTVIELPSFTYNLKTNVLTERPNWYREASTTSLNQKAQNTFIIYIQTVEGKPNLRCSKYENGKLREQNDDWSLPITKEKIPIVDYYRHYDKQHFLVNNLLYYKHRGQWLHLDTAAYQQYGSLQSVTPLGDDLWLCYNNVLIRVSKLSKEGFVFTSKNGVPDNLKKLYLDNNQMYILAKSGVYKFDPDEGNAMLLLPWLQANSLRYDAAKITKLKHNQNNIIIPVDVLNTLVPESIRLNYRLLGYDKEWKQRDYSPQIEYPLLPPGRYEFQTNATSPTGRQSKTLSLFFTISPPLYANWWAYLLYAIGLFFLGRQLYRMRVKQLQARNTALENTVALRTQELREWQQHTLDSIEYAALIQKSILPQESDLNAAFDGHFIIWNPRDIVGGDFYWLHTLESGEVMFAIIDCTGHGVPGALLSMTVNSLLDHLVHDRGIHQPSAIFSELHRKIGSTLHQDKAHTQQDGIEIALLKIDKAAGNIVFCGAGLHLLHYDVDTKELQHIRGNKYGIGGLKWHLELQFDEQIVPFSAKSRCYLYTDGIIDQPVPRREKERRLGHPGWLELVSSIASNSLQEQESLLNERLGIMLAYHEQRDDITIVGLKIE